MPIYEYVCQSCGAIVELLQKVGASAPETCGNCGESDTMAKKVSQTSFQLKGGGWYSDLYASTPNKGGGSSGSSKSSDSGASSASKETGSSTGSKSD